MSEQAENLGRVRHKIAHMVEAFCDARLKAGRPQFNLDELERHVLSAGMLTPGSAGRILRDLRAAGRIGYRVVNRRQSLYELEAPGKPKQYDPHDEVPV